MYTLNVESHFLFSWNEMQRNIIILTELMWSDYPSFHYDVTIQYAPVKIMCYFRDVYVRSNVVFILRVLIRFFAWARDKIGCYGREIYGVIFCCEWWER
jgi:hypothetical protein